jgi:hypothetical protein
VCHARSAVTLRVEMEGRTVNADAEFVVVLCTGQLLYWIVYIVVNLM